VKSNSRHTCAAVCRAQRGCRKTLFIRAFCCEPNGISSVIGASRLEPNPWKVDTQWKLFCLVHNIEKLAHHGYAQSAELLMKRKPPTFEFTGLRGFLRRSGGMMGWAGWFLGTGPESRSLGGQRRQHQRRLKLSCNTSHECCHLACHSEYRRRDVCHRFGCLLQAIGCYG